MTRCERAIAYLKAKDSISPGERATTVPQSDTPVVRDFAEGLCACYVIDEGSSLSFIQRRDLEQEGYTVETLHARAIENLSKIARSRLRVAAQPGEFFATLLDGNFEASLMLLDRLWEAGLRHLLPHDFVVAPAARDILPFCDSESDQGLQSLRQIVSRIWPDGDHLISQNLYRRRPTGWERIS